MLKGERPESRKKRHNTAGTVMLRGEKPAYGGIVIARHENRVVFVEGALPGELVSARITEEKQDYARASLIAVVEPSPDRTEPPCPVFGECGGCQLQYVRYERQVTLKEEVLQDALRRLASLPCELDAPIVDEDSWGYRHRAQFKTDGEKTGFYRKSSRTVVDVGRCLVACEGINAAYSALRTLAIMPPLQDYFSWITGFHLISNNTDTAALFTARSGTVPEPGLIEAITERLGFAGCSALSGSDIVASAGRPAVDFMIGTLVYQVSVDSFFQGHWRLNQRVVEAVRAALAAGSGTRVLDLYAGAGNFALPLAGNADEVVAIEEHPRSITDGRMNCERNQIRNVRFIGMQAEDYEPEGHFHAVLLDPPRLGLSNKVVDTVLRSSPESIVYVSCNPSTMARDLRKLCRDYDLVSVRLIDFFPHTFHIESMAVLRRK